MMDGLVEAELAKLATLNQKVVDYRRGLATEFRRYSSELLAKEPEEVSRAVETAVRDSMWKYPDLSPALDDVLQPVAVDSSPNPDDADARDDATPAESDPSWRELGCKSPPPELPHTSGPRGVHDREREFQGLFTPSYLPLLDGTERNIPSMSSQPTAPQTAEAPPAQPTATLPLPPSSPPPPPSAPAPPPASEDAPPVGMAVRPPSIRRHTAETSCSQASDASTSGQSRRSALRRSSSASTKTASPRRVRFETEEGGEVLPTEEPLSSPSTLHPASQQPTGGGNAVIKHFKNRIRDMKGSYDSIFSDNKSGPDSDSGSLANSPPRPKKITSTDKLKALMRSSKEDTSTWTVVGDQDPDDDDDDVLTMARPNGKSPQTTPSNAKPVEDNGVNDEVLAELPPLTSFKGKKSFSPPGSPAKAETAVSDPPAEPANPDKSVAETPAEDSDDLFEYESEDEGLTMSVGPKRRSGPSKPGKYIEDYDDEVPDTGSPGGAEPETEDQITASLMSTSPAVRINRRPASAGSSAASGGSNNPGDAPSAMTGVAGSYGGRPFTFDIVKNHDVLRQVAGMGDISSFVGSVDGRTGVDEAPPISSGSYRPPAARASFSGTPKSFSERLMMEEMMERRAAARGGKAVEAATTTAGLPGVPLPGQD